MNINEHVAKVEALRKQLQVEERALATEIEVLREARNAALFDVLSDRVIDVLVPEHSRTSCSDDNLSNSHDARCARCTLLKAQTDGYLPSNVEFDFIIRRST